MVDHRRRGWRAVLAAAVACGLGASCSGSPVVGEGQAVVYYDQRRLSDAQMDAIAADLEACRGAVRVWFTTPDADQVRAASTFGGGARGTTGVECHWPDPGTVRQLLLTCRDGQWFELDPERGTGIAIGPRRGAAACP